MADDARDAYEQHECASCGSYCGPDGCTCPMGCPEPVAVVCADEIAGHKSRNGHFVATEYDSETVVKP